MELVAVMRSAFLISFNSKQNVFVIVTFLFDKTHISFEIQLRCGGLIIFLSSAIHHSLQDV